MKRLVAANVVQERHQYYPHQRLRHLLQVLDEECSLHAEVTVVVTLVSLDVTEFESLPNVTRL